MKNLILVLGLVLISLPAQSQKIRKIIEKHNGGVQLSKYLEKKGDVHETIPVTYNDETGEVTKMVHPLTYSVIEENWDAMDAILQRFQTLQDEEDEQGIEDSDDAKLRTKAVSQAYIYSLSKDDKRFSNTLNNYQIDYDQHCEICHGNNALMTAAVHGKEQTYYELKEKSELLYTNYAGSNLLHAAANGPNEKILMDVLAIEGMKDLIDVPDKLGNTPLDYAVRNENDIIFSLVIKAGADPEKAKNLTYGSAFYFNKGFSMWNRAHEFKMKEIWKLDEEGLNALSVATFWNEDAIHKMIETNDFFQLEYLIHLLEIMKEEMESNEGANYDRTPFESFPVVENIWYYISWCNEFDDGVSWALGEALFNLQKTAMAFGKKGPLDEGAYKVGCKIVGKDWLELQMQEQNVELSK